MPSVLMPPESHLKLYSITLSLINKRHRLYKMKPSQLAAYTILLSAQLFACVDDSAVSTSVNPPNESGGTSGVAGAAGVSGDAGTAGSSGAESSGGSGTTAGSSGSAGNAGNAGTSGTASSGGSAGSIDIGGNSGAPNGGSAGSAGTSCLAEELPAAPAEFMFFVDTTASWNSKVDRWNGVKLAVIDFAQEAAAQHTLALSVFPVVSDSPEGVSCDPSDYHGYTIDWGSNESFADSLNELTLQGQSPLSHALRGATEQALTRFALSTTKTVSVILVTDATPFDDEICLADWQEVSDATSAGFSNGLGASVHTHVLSVIGTAVSPDHFGRLADIAGKGAGYAAFVNGGTSDIHTSSLDAFRYLSQRMPLCSRVIASHQLPETLDVIFPDGSINSANLVSDASQCTGASFYVDSQESPNVLTLCSGDAGVGGFCELVAVKANSLGEPTFQIPCAPLLLLPDSKPKHQFTEAFRINRCTASNAHPVHTVEKQPSLVFLCYPYE